MFIIHASAECFPVAKVGGMGDVVGALPKYLNKQGHSAWVVMPKYDNDWTKNHSFSTVWKSESPLGNERFSFSIQREKDDSLDFPLYMIDIPGRFDRPGVYTKPTTGEAYEDEFKRFMSFQIALLDWMVSREEVPDILHCHDHHMGLIPFMLSNCFRYETLRELASVFTVHNAEYQGVHPISNYGLLPGFDLSHIGLLEWDERLNALSAGIKCAWQVSTVSQSYMEELKTESNGLEVLFTQESEKCVGIMNGIDTSVWDPETDPLIEHNFSVSNRMEGKNKNKQVLCEQFSLNEKYPLVGFIGRLVQEKGADLLPKVFKHMLEMETRVNFVVLGTGNLEIHEQFKEMKSEYVGFFDATLEYNEPLAHQIYAGSDFIIMPSRVEPCGLNQMYAMRYGTIPIVRSVGGLKDSVVDLKESEGYGIRFDHLEIEEISRAIERGVKLHRKGNTLKKLRKVVMEKNFSWNASAKEYIKMYRELINR